VGPVRRLPDRKIAGIGNRSSIIKLHTLRPISQLFTIFYPHLTAAAALLSSFYQQLHNRFGSAETTDEIYAALE
jgi:hypothetical protein